MRKESELEGLDVFHLERGLEVLHKRRKDSLERYPDRKDDEVAEKVYQLRQNRTQQNTCLVFLLLF